ncbi:MAG: DNA primase [Myxococcales bacterium]|nr:DNA primase [Myxococcales bacterium]
MAVRIPDEFVREVVDRTDLLKLIGSYVELKKAGASYKGLCPFHQEKTPSFHVHPDRGYYHCFGCQRGGDAIRFVTELHGYSFVDAVTDLASRAGLEVPTQQDSRPSKPGTGRRELLEVHRVAQQFYENCAAQSKDFSEFLEVRGLSREIASKFRLSLAPAGWDGLINHLMKTHRHLIPAAAAAGLIKQKQGGSGYYDRFRNRVMFAVQDPAGEVVAFSGRTLETDTNEAKYVNSPETGVYRKGRVLYGMPQARDAWRADGRAILVEGNVDVVRLHQNGYVATVAPLGTAMTSEQATILARFVSEVVLFYDGDSAGEAATLRGLPSLFEAGLDVFVARPPEGSDPDDMAGSNPEELQTVLASAQPAVHYLVGSLREKHGTSPAALGRIIGEGMDIISRFTEEAASMAAAWNLYRLLGIEDTVTDRDLRARLRQEKSTGARRNQAIPSSEPTNEPIEDVTLSRDELFLGSLLTRHPDLARRFLDDGGAGLIEADVLTRLFCQLADPETDTKSDPAVEKLHRELLFEQTVPVENVEAEAMYLEILFRLELANVERESRRVQAEIDIAERTSNEARLNALRDEKLQLMQLRRELQSGGRRECEEPPLRSEHAGKEGS